MEHGLTTTALMVAVLNDHESIVKLLLNDQRCNINLRDNYGSTALLLAKARKNTTIRLGPPHQ